MITVCTRLTLWQFGAFLWAALFHCTIAIAGADGDDDEPISQEQHLQAQRVALKVREHADAALRGRIEIVNRICGLTNAQRQKLALAGRGDIKKVLGSATTGGALPAAPWPRRGFATPALPARDSLFLKLLDRILTVDQAQKYTPVRPVLWAGGSIGLARRGEIDAVEINLSGTDFGDDDLADMSEWPPTPALWSLNLSGTNVTDAGLVRLQRLSQLAHLDLSRTAITDSGLRELSILPRLKHLTLEGLSERLDDAAIEDLKRASPALEIHW